MRCLKKTKIKEEKSHSNVNTCTMYIHDQYNNNNNICANNVYITWFLLMDISSSWLNHKIGLLIMLLAIIIFLIKKVAFFNTM